MSRLLFAMRLLRLRLRGQIKVQAIGFSFGGECFFETGVTPTSPFNSEQFSSSFSEN